MQQKIIYCPATTFAILIEFEKFVNIIGGDFRILRIFFFFSFFSIIKFIFYFDFSFLWNFSTAESNSGVFAV